MKQIKHGYVVVAALAVAGLMALQTAQAGVITAADIADGSGAFTTTDTLVTLTPYAEGGSVGTFGSNELTLFGVTGGFNANSLGDRDGNPATTADRESLGIGLDATVGLSQIAFAWGRADGPAADDGVVISGFLSDPGAAISGYGILNNNGITYNAGSLYVSVYAWSGTSTVLDFSNISASMGQTLTLSVNDSDAADPRLSMNSVSYAIPEPATMGLLAAFGGGILFIRRRFMM